MMSTAFGSCLRIPSGEGLTVYDYWAAWAWACAFSAFGERSLRLQVWEDIVRIQEIRTLTLGPWDLSPEPAHP